MAMAKANFEIPEYTYETETDYKDEKADKKRQASFKKNRDKRKRLKRSKK